MARISQLVLIIAALFATLAAGATTVATSGSATGSNFATAPLKIVDSTNTTDLTLWAAIPYTQVVVGSGAINTTAYLYGYTLAGGKITSVISRSVNTTTLASTTAGDATELAVSKDTTATVSWAYSNEVVAGAGGGYIALAYDNTDAATPATDQLYVSIVQGGAASAAATKVAITANAAVTCVTTAAGPPAVAGVDGISYSYTISNVWYQDGMFYVAYVTTTATTPKATCTNPVSVDTSVSVQGVNITSGAVVWTKPVSVATLTNTGGSTSVMTHQSNYTASTYIWVAYTVGSGSTGTVVANTVKVADGSLGTAVTVGTNAATAATANAAGSSVTYTPAGFVAGNTIGGVLLNNVSTATLAGPGAVTTTYGLALYNLTGSAASTSGFTAASAVSPGFMGGMGYAFNSSAYAIIASYASAAASGSQPITYTYAYGVFNSSGSAATTQTSIASVGGGTATYFQDVNASALWFGYLTYDVANSNNVLTVYLGKLIGTSVTTGSAGNILATFFSFLFFVVVTLFAF